MPSLITAAAAASSCGCGGPIFDHPAGAAVAIPVSTSSTLLPFTVTLDWFDPNTIMAIMAGASLRRGSRQQFLYTLGDVLYAQAFGQLLGEVSISGMVFSALCGSTVVGANTGVALLQDYFDSYSFGSRGMPIGLNFGGRSLAAFLVGLVIDIRDVQSGLYGFTMSLLFPPVVASAAAASAAAPALLNEA